MVVTVGFATAIREQPPPRGPRAPQGVIIIIIIITIIITIIAIKYLIIVIMIMIMIMIMITPGVPLGC